MQAAEFDTRQILETAQANVTNFALSVLAYSKRQGQSFDDWVRFTGEMFAPGWGALADKSPLSVAREAALNLVSGGATAVALSGDERRAEVTAVWPSDEFLAFINLSREEAVTFLRIFVPIAEHVGLRYEQAQQGDRTLLSFSR